MVGLLAKDCAKPFTSGIDRNLQIEVANINKKCPMMVDEVTRLDSTKAEEGRKLHYYYTVLNISKANFDREGFARAMRPSVIEQYRTDVSMTFFRKYEVIMIFHYRDEAGAELASFTVTPDDL